MQVDPNIIKPSQDFLKPKTVRFIAECVLTNQAEKLPPNPIVRKDQDGNLVAIDGHNLIAYMCYTNQPIDVHLANSPNDGLEDSSEANRLRNIDLFKKFDTVLEEQYVTQAKGIATFSDLINKYPELFL